MVDTIQPGLYRTTVAMPGAEDGFPAGVLVYVGERENGTRFVVRPGSNRRNRWFWGEPVTALPRSSWGWTLRRLPSEGYYTLPETLEFEGGGRWLKNAIVQLGYNESGRGILFIAEEREGEARNVLEFSSYGRVIDDALLERLSWAPILPVRAGATPLVDPN